jgi:hypothetical protein
MRLYANTSNAANSKNPFAVRNYRLRRYSITTSTHVGKNAFEMGLVRAFSPALVRHRSSQ